MKDFLSNLLTTVTMREKEQTVKIKNINLNLFSFLMMFAASFLLMAGAALAQSNQPTPKQLADEANALESNNCASARVFSFGAGAQKFAFCITDRGNIQNLEFPAGYQHISNGEGYAVCSDYTTRGYDAGVAQKGFDAPTITQPGGPHTLPLTIMRQSTDGKVSLKQEFDWSKDEKEILITMTVKNLSAATITHVYLTRYFDGDMDGDNGDDIYNNTHYSILAREGNNPFGQYDGLALTGLSFNYFQAPQVVYYEEWNPNGTSYKAATQCGSNGSVDGSMLYDYVGILTYDLKTIAPGAVKTAKFVYRRM
jgi:hypothetical protein